MQLLRRVLKRAAAAAAIVVLAAGAHHGFVTVPVTVDGEPVAVRPGVALVDVVAASSAAEAGDLVSASDGRVIGPGEGSPVIVLVNGQFAEPYRTVRTGDRVQAYSGADVVEPVLTETRTVEPEPVTIGRGPIERVVAEGRTGLERVTFGAVSKDVIARETLIPAEPAVVRRTPAPGAKVVALTFDDGPWPGQTDAVLAVLAEKDVPATFFMVGSRVKAHPEIARRVAQAGHAVGNHTFRHTLLGAAPPGIVRREIRRADQAIARATGVTPRWFRAPAGELSPEVFRELRRDGLRSALWTVDPHDWGEGVKAATIARRVSAAARPGAIILLHDGGGDRRETVRALPRIIDELRSKGYEFVTLDELGRVRGSW